MKEILPFGHFWASNYGGAGGGSPGVYEQAQLYMDFTANQARLSGAWSTAASLLTYNRNSVGYIDDSAGNWTQVSNVNTPRMSNKGLLIEEARTNSVTNNAMVGAVAGSAVGPAVPGTLPTNWFLGGGSGVTLTTSFGVEQGMDYAEFKYQGNCTDGYIAILMDAAMPGIQFATTYTQSVFASLKAGSLAGYTIQMLQRAYLSAGGPADSYTALLTVGSGSVSLPANRLVGTGPQLVSGGATITQAQQMIMFVLPGAVPGPVDFTVRLGWPQCEAGAFATSPIRTSAPGVASTRAMDTAVISPLGAWFNAAAGTLWTESVDPNATNGVTGVFPGSAAINDGGYNSRISLYRSASSFFAADVRDASVVQASMNIGALTTAPRKAAIAYTLNDFAACGGGGTVQTDAVGTVPVVNQMTIGGLAPLTGGPLNGYLRRLAYWNTRLSNALLQAITAP